MKKIKQACIIFILLFSQFSKIEAQITSSSINGKVTDIKGEALPGVVIVATHLPTGSKYNTMADLNGKYFIPNMNPGGPYSIKANAVRKI